MGNQEDVIGNPLLGTARHIGAETSTFDVPGTNSCKLRSSTRLRKQWLNNFWRNLQSAKSWP